MSRYNKTLTIVDRNGKRKQSTTILNNVITDQDIFIQTTSPERLDKLAFTFYRDATLWWIIAAANNIKLGSLIVYPDTIIRIPNPNALTSILEYSNKPR